MLALLEGAFLMAVAVLQLRLKVARPAISDRAINPPRVLIPGREAARAVGDVIEELLIPTRGPIELRRELVFRLYKIAQRISVAGVRDFESGGDRLGPDLPMMVSV